LTIASGMTIHRLAPVETTARERKIDEPDEVTVVRAREEPAYVAPSVPRREPVRVPVPGAVPPPPQTAASFNPMKILIPAAVAVLVVFGLFFVFNRNTPATDANTNQQPQTQTLAADPNSQPVQVASPATGRSEEGLPSGGSINPSANVNASPNANAAVSPEFSPTENANENSNANSNSNSNSNSNRKAPALPEPTKSVLPETQPPPVPSATKPPAEKPSPTPTP
jgi:hypothetical protein